MQGIVVQGFWRCMRSMRRCSASMPTSLASPWQITPAVVNTGEGLPGPKGWKRFRSRRNAGVMSEKSSSPSMSTCGTSIWGSMFSSTKALKRRVNSSTFSGRMVSPAAYMCPPKFSSRSEHDSTAW